jgi:hypothetical protein
VAGKRSKDICLLFSQENNFSIFFKFRVTSDWFGSIFLVVLGFELKALDLLGKHSTT